MAIGVPTSIGSATAFDAGSTTLAMTVTSAVAVGQKVIVAAGCDTAGITATFSDSKGNSYVTDATANSVQTCSGFIGSSQITVALTTSDTITVTLSASEVDRCIAAVQVSGLLAASPLDKIATNNNAVAGWDSTATVTTTQADELVFGFGLDNDGAINPTSTPGGGLTELHDINNTDGVSLTTVYKIVSATGAYSATGTWTAGGTYHCQAAVATYKGAPSALAIKPFNPVPFMSNRRI